MGCQYTNFDTPACPCSLPTGHSHLPSSVNGELVFLKSEAYVQLLTLLGLFCQFQVVVQEMLFPLVLISVDVWDPTPLAVSSC